MLNSKLPPHELTLDRLHHEAASILGGGIDTTKTALTVASFFIVSNPEIYQRLHQELMEAIPDTSAKPPTLAQLEALPYLNAVVQEGKKYHSLPYSLTNHHSPPPLPWYNPTPPTHRYFPSNTLPRQPHLGTLHHSP